MFANSGKVRGVVKNHALARRGRCCGGTPSANSSKARGRQHGLLQVKRQPQPPLCPRVSASTWIPYTCLNANIQGRRSSPQSLSMQSDATCDGKDGVFERTWQVCVLSSIHLHCRKVDHVRCLKGLLGLRWQRRQML